jgi:predicted metal-binding membrane protein
MTIAAQGAPTTRRGPGVVAGLLLVAAVAWAGTFAVAQQMGVMAGTMGLAVPAFLLVWLLMMTAMMLPAVSPVARLYLRTIGPDRRASRVAGFLSGYLLVWTAAGVPAFALAWAAQKLATDHAGAARLVAAATFVAVAGYQVSPLKDVCLKACRSPLGLLMRYASYRGRFRDVRAGAHHGLYCLGCCWVLFVALIALGTMNILAMALLAAVLTAEKLWAHGPALSRVMAVAALVLAVVVLAKPSMAAGLYVPAAPMGM